MPDHGQYKEDGWNEYRRLVTGTLDELNKDLKDLERKVDSNTRTLQDKMIGDVQDLTDKLTKMDKAFAISLARLQDKSRMWGAIAGTIGGAIISALVAKLIR